MRNTTRIVVCPPLRGLLWKVDRRRVGFTLVELVASTAALVLVLSVAATMPRAAREASMQQECLDQLHPESVQATAKSGTASLFRWPTGYGAGAANVPEPRPSSTDTLSSTRFVVTRSGTSSSSR